jgi:hypothetical protein
MGESWDWLHRKAVQLQKEPAYATRRCNDEALPEIGRALSEANAVWKQRNAVVHASWMVCPSLIGGTCQIAASKGGEVEDDEYHVARSIRGRTAHEVEHRYAWELEDLVVEFESVRQDLIDGLKTFDPSQFR